MNFMLVFLMCVQYLGFGANQYKIILSILCFVFVIRRTVSGTMCAKRANVFANMTRINKHNDCVMHRQEGAIQLQFHSFS